MRANTLLALPESTLTFALTLAFMSLRVRFKRCNALVALPVSALTFTFDAVAETLSTCFLTSFV
jgi:hypothetical protein